MRKKGKEFFYEFFTENEVASSKRLVGIACALTLCFLAIYKGITGDSTEISHPIVESIAMLAFGSLGLTTVKDIFKKVAGAEDAKEKKSIS